MFDLPILASAERRAATRFRNDLLDLGFQMAQFSENLRHAHSKTKADVIAAKVGELVPPAGRVQIPFSTDRQYQLTQAIRAEPDAGRSNRNRISLGCFDIFKVNFSLPRIKKFYVNQKVVEDLF